MRYITSGDLMARVRTFAWRESAQKHLKEAAKDASTRVFLSHSHKDKDLVQSIKQLFAQFEVDVYIDSLDHGLPEETSPATAKLLRDRIASSLRFVLLATPRSLSSLWVPWELGCADGIKGYPEVAVMPVLVDSGNWVGNEYVGLYLQIKEESGSYYVCPPDGTKPEPLGDWLRPRFLNFSRPDPR